VALGELTKQLAEHAIGNALKAPPPAPEGLGPTLVAQLQAMQKALKEDDELVVLYHAGTETVRVMELIVPSWHVAVLSGLDSAKNLTRVISPFESLQLICKVMKAQPGAKPSRIGFVLPKA
jgi:hypothetical protein